MKSKQEIEDYMNDVKSRMKDYNDFNRTVATGSILALEYVLGGMDSQPETEMKINVKYELNKAAYKQFIVDMKEIEAEFKQQNCTMSPERNAEITAELERQIRTGELNPKSIGHIPAKLKDVCEWWIKTYPEDVFHYTPVQVIEIRNNMKEILNNLK